MCLILRRENLRRANDVRFEKLLEPSFFPTHSTIEKLDPSDSKRRPLVLKAKSPFQQPIDDSSVKQQQLIWQKEARSAVAWKRAILGAPRITPSAATASGGTARRNKPIAPLCSPTTRWKSATASSSNCTCGKPNATSKRFGTDCGTGIPSKKQPKRRSARRRTKQHSDGNSSSTEEPTAKKKRGRKGPETWKLRGAARPAHEVYDFDTRYVDPHLVAHKQAREKAQRRQNLLHPRLFDPHTIPACREYLGLLMQLGHICAEARQYKSAREAWLECLELDNNERRRQQERSSSCSLDFGARRPDAALPPAPPL